MSSISPSSDVVARALAEVAKAREFRERTEKLREETRKRLPQKASVYVLAWQAKQKGGEAPCKH